MGVRIFGVCSEVDNWLERSSLKVQKEKVLRYLDWFRVAIFQEFDYVSIRLVLESQVVQIYIQDYKQCINWNSFQHYRVSRSSRMNEKYITLNVPADSPVPF